MRSVLFCCIAICAFVSSSASAQQQGFAVLNSSDSDYSLSGIVDGCIGSSQLVVAELFDASSGELRGQAVCELTNEGELTSISLEMDETQTQSSILIGDVSSVVTEEVIATLLILVVGDPPIEEQIDKVFEDRHWEEHVDDWSEADLDDDGKIEGDAEIDILKDTFTDIMTNPKKKDKKTLKDGRIGYWDPDGERVIIFNPNGACTAFKPDRGRDYFDDLK